VVFEHLNRLAARGHDCQLFVIALSDTQWTDLDVPVVAFQSYQAMLAALYETDGLKVATWWETASLVRRSCLRRGTGVYFVQDIESSYRLTDPAYQLQVHATYTPDLFYVTTSPWIQQTLRRYFGLQAEIVSPWVDLEVFRPTQQARDGSILAIGRREVLKNQTAILGAWRLLNPRPPLKLFGVEPMPLEPPGQYILKPTDAGLCELYNQASVFLQPSLHEGFGLPMLEAMACGCPVITTACHGNEHFIRDGYNCIVVPWYDNTLIARAIRLLLNDTELAQRLIRGGLETVQSYTWSESIDRLETLYAQWNSR